MLPDLAAHVPLGRDQPPRECGSDLLERVQLPPHQYGARRPFHTRFGWATNYRLVVQWSNSQFARCNAAVKSVALYIERPLTTPGRVVTLPDDKVQLHLSAGDANQGCSTWTGSVTWDSDLPHWKVRVDATCSAVGKSHIKLVGVYSGSP